MPDTHPWGPKPDMLTGYDKAGSCFEAVLRDAEKRLLLAGERTNGNLVVPARVGDVTLHTQHRATYADPTEKERIVEAAYQILQKTARNDKPEAQLRFQEALAAMTHEEERVFIVIVTSNVRDFVYWNWEHGYTLDSWRRGNGWKRFRTDTWRRKVAAPNAARAAYREAIVRVTPTE